MSTCCPHRTLAAILLAAAAAGSSGCLGPDIALTAGVNVARAGAGAYIGGELIQAFSTPMSEVVDATRCALAQLEFQPGTEREGGASYFFLVREHCGREIAIRVETVTPNVSRIKIRVGIWGDHPLSQLILREVEETMERAAGGPKDGAERDDQSAAGAPTG